MSNDFDQWRTSTLSKNSKKSMRRRKRNLLSNYGNFELVKETSEDGLNRALNAFFEQKAAAQFSRGIPNPFSVPENRNLITDIAQENLQSHHGLKVFCLKSNDYIHAVSLVIEGSTHFSAFANSVNDRSLVFSPGRLIQSSILQHQHSKGRYSFDLGLGFDEYKKEWASASVVLNCLLPINFKGVVLAALIYFKQTILRKLKQTGFGRSVVRRIKILLLKQKA